MRPEGNGRGSSGWADSLSARITLVVMGILLAFSATLGVTTYLITAGWLTSTAEDKLEALATARQAAIEVQVARHMDAFAAFGGPDFSDHVRSVLRTGVELSEADRRALARELTRSVRTSELTESASLLTPDGTTLATSRAPDEGDTLGARFLSQALLRAAVSAPVNTGEGWRLDVAGPIRADDGTVLALLRLRKHADRLLGITGDHRGLGASGETVVGTRVGDAIHFVLPRRFAPGPSLARATSAGVAVAAPMIAATAGQTGQFIALDYRGMRVLASYRPVAGTSWGMVVKQDMDEILANARRVRLALLLALVGLQGAALALVFPVLRTFVQPLRTLERATVKVAAGDLAVHVPEEGTSELRGLGAAFNAMVKRLGAAQAEASRRQQELESFSYVVSHDLRAPLRGVNNLAEWLEQDLAGTLAAKSQEHLRLLRERVELMNALIDGVLEYSRAGRAMRPEERVQVEDLVSRILEVLPPRAGIEVTVVHPLPEVSADPVRLSQIFQNLIGNAIQHHPGPVGTVEVSCREQEEAWEFTIRDDGDGIHPQYHERVFEIFQVLERRPGTESTGIGLAVVKKIVEDRGGEIWIESEGVPGQGATFRFTWNKKEKEGNA